MMMSLIYVFIFFFQAEYGILYWSVTGVQTCALPILALRACLYAAACVTVLVAWSRAGPALWTEVQWEATRDASRAMRSEERRVGKECRSLRWPDHAKNNTTETADRQ